MAEPKDPPKSPVARETKGEGAPKRKRNEGTAITAYRPDGSVAWTDSGYGGALLAPVGDDQVLICDSEESWTVAVEGAVG